MPLKRFWSGVIHRLTPASTAALVMSGLALTVSLSSWVYPMGHSQPSYSPLMGPVGFEETNNQAQHGLKLAAHENDPATLFKSNNRAIIGSPSLIADVAETVAPSVVNIDVEKHTTQPEVPALPDELLERFFGMSPMAPNRGMSERIISGNGSGILVDTSGHILTNNHVIASADTITVTFQKGEKVPAHVLGRDPFTDLAVLKLDQPVPKSAIPAQMGSSNSLRPGDWVLAVGSPLGFDHTVTLGIISAISRQVPDINSNVEFLQTDAAINPGNSGGPLVNLRGEVVGINTAINGRAQNMGFAIPIDLAKTVVNQLIGEGKITRPWIGISMSTMTPEIAKSMGISESTHGVVVAQVIPGSPAEKAGFAPGDIIQRIDGAKMDEAKTVQNLVREKGLQAKLNVQILREGKLMALGVTTEELPADPNGTSRPQPQPRHSGVTPSPQGPQYYYREFHFP